MKYFFSIILIGMLAGCNLNTKSSDPVIIEAPPSVGTQIDMPHSSARPIFNHLALLVTDFEKSARFYRDVIGLDTIPNPFNDGKHIWFDLGSKSALHIIGGASSRMEHPRDNHICFSFQSLDGFIQKLAKEKIPFEDARGKSSAITVRPDGVKQIYFKDPDGYWVEINDARK